MMLENKLGITDPSELAREEGEAGWIKMNICR